MNARNPDHAFYSLTQLHPMMFQNPGYAHGDSLLHLAIRQFQQLGRTNISILDDLIRDAGMEAVIYMSVITNDDGKTPMHLLVELERSYPDDDNVHRVINQLTEIMKQYPLKALNESLELDDNVYELSAGYNLRSKNNLRNNLQLAVKLTNEVRKRINVSSTHPSWNNFNARKKNLVIKSVSAVREAVMCKPVSLDDIENIAFHAESKRTGNCYEFSRSILALLRKVNPGVSAEAVNVVFGDHVFVVIDRQAGSDIKNVATWGDSAVICDAWLGEVYPADQLPFRLMSYYDLPPINVLSSTNLLNTYNPRFHQLGVAVGIPAKAVKLHQAGLFKPGSPKSRTAEAAELNVLPVKRRK